MKQVLLIGFMATTMTYANMSHADYFFHSNNSDSCAHISGQWTGKGQASSRIIGNCKYHGIGTLSTVDQDGNFSIIVNVYKDSGSPLCPYHAARHLNAVCLNGSITIKTEYGNLLGYFSENECNAKGTLSVSPGIEAKVSIQFQRTG